MPEALTIDSAVALLEAAPPEEAPATPPVAAIPAAEAPAVDPAAVEAAPETPADPAVADDADPLLEAIGEVMEEPDPAAEQAPAIEAPRSWNAEERAQFAKLPREAQTIVVAREAERDSRVAKAVQEANDAKKSVEAQQATLAEITGRLNDSLPNAITAFETRWGKTEPEWDNLIDTHGAEQTLKWQNQYARERNALGQAARDKAAVEDQLFVQFVQAETVKLAQIAPQLADPVKGPALRSSVAQYAIDQGAVAADQVKHVSAAQLHIAHKAMQWDRAQALLAAKQAQKTPANPAAPKSPATPAATPSAAAPANAIPRAQQELRHRFAQTRSLEDAVAVLNARN